MRSNFMSDSVPNPSPLQPARGERAALIGYHPQYRGAAALLMPVLDDNTFEFVRIADPSAGRVDDWQVFTRDRLDAYQFKWSEFPKSFTVSDLLSGNSEKPALLRTLVDGWLERMESFRDRRVYIHLITNGYPSNSPIPSESQGDEFGRKHLAAFLADSWEAVHTGAMPIPRLGMAWSKTWQKIRTVSGLSNDELTEFVKACHLKFEQNSKPPGGLSDRETEAWEAEVRNFTERMLSIHSNPSPQVTFNRSQLLELFGLNPNSVSPRLHEFRLDPNVREPLRKTAAGLEDSLARISRGYICLSGSPGSGKSSTLTLILRRSSERVIHYYAYTPDSPNENQGESACFFSRLVEELNRAGFRHKGTAPHRGDLVLLKQRFKEQIQELSDDHAKTRRKTVILIDGLDHIQREQRPDRSLLSDLPSPGEIPDGVVLLLGTQTQLVLKPDIRQSLRETGRSVETSSLDTTEVERILMSSKTGSLLNRHQLNEAFRIVAGHPLALGYLIRKLDVCETPESVDLVLNEQEAFTGNILESYRTYWDDLGNSGFKVKQLLGYLARLRRPAEFDWLMKWADREALEQLRSKFSHYFERSNSSWQFFHNSFRIFVLDATCENPDGRPNDSINQDYHKELADLCSASPAGSLWLAEQFHHLAEAGRISDALEIANPGWFRAQFLAMRGRGEIHSDLRKAQCLAATVQSGLHVCRLAIAEQEIESRYQALEFDSNRMLKIFLQAGRTADAMRLIRTEKRLLVSHEYGLELCNLLREIGEEGEAAKVFDLINPYTSDAHSPGQSNAKAQRNMLVEWGLAASSYLPIEEILAVFENCVFKAGDAWTGRDESQCEPDQKLERAKAIAAFSIRAEERFGQEVANALEKFVDWTILPKMFRMDFVLSRFQHLLDADDQNPARGGDIHHITAELLELVPHAGRRRLFYALEVFIRLGEMETARNIFSKIAPSDIARDLGREVSTDEPERIAREWLRIAQALGENNLAKSLFHDPSISGRRMSATLATSHLSVALLHAESWLPDLPRQVSLAGHFAQILAPMDKGFLDADEWSEVHRSMPGILDDLVTACRANGQAAITVLCEFLSGRWKHPHGRKGWPLGLQRRLLTDLGHAGANPAWITEWLEVCEDNIEISTTSGGRVTELIDQAEAWLAAGEPGRALTTASQAFEYSLGIGYHKDYQLNGWILFLRHFWNENWKDSLPLIAQIARSAVSLLHDTHGGAMGEAAELLVVSCFQAEPLLGVKLWDYFDREAATSFPDTIAGILKTSSKCSNDDPQIAFLILCDILVPIMDSSDPDLVVHLLGRLLHAHGAENTQRSVEQLAARIGSLARSEHRAGWWRGLRRGCKKFGFFLPSPPIDISFNESGDEATEEAIARIEEADDPVGTLGEIIETHRARQAGGYYSSYLDLRRVVHVIADSIPAGQIERCRELLANESYLATAMIEALAKRVPDPSIRTILWNWGKDLHTIAHEKASMSSPIESEIRPLFVALVTAEPSKGLDLLFESLRDHRWLSSASLDQLGHHLITSPAERHAFSLEVSNQVESLLLGLSDDAPSLPFEELAETTSASGSVALMRLVFRWLDHPSGALRHGARRIFRHFCQFSNSTWRAELVQHLSVAGEAPVVLGLLDAASHDVLLPMIDSLVPPLIRLSRSSDFESRGLASNLLSKLAKEVPRPIMVDPLHPTYRLALPPFHVDAGPIARYMGDFVSTCNLVTAIPKANLYQRLNELGEELLRSNGMDRHAITRQLADTGLYFEFPLPERKIGLRVAFRMLAELQDAGFVPNAEVMKLLRIFSDQDHSVSPIVPDIRPVSVPTLEAGKYSQAWSEEWLDQCEEHPLETPPLAHDGWIITGYRHSIRVHTDHCPREVHLGLLVQEADQESIDVQDHESTFFGRDQPAHFTDYHDWSEDEDQDDCPLFVLGGQSMDLPCPPWLALHPERARELGWFADQSSLFGWKDASGKKTAESRWWADGPHQCTSTHGNRITAAGWITVLSPEAFAPLIQKFGPMGFTSAAGRYRAR
jgi:Cdc6-like AAA superfamily ATPase